MTTSEPLNPPKKSWLRDFPYWHEAILALFARGLAHLGAYRRARICPIRQSARHVHASMEQALLTIPMTLIIITAGIDLSVGSTIALCAVVLGMSFKYGWPGLIGVHPKDPHGLSIWLSTFLALITGALAGAANGFFIAKLRVHPLIVTLATLAAYRGIAEGISLGEPTSGFPRRLPSLATARLWASLLPAGFFWCLRSSRPSFSSKRRSGVSICHGPQRDRDAVFGVAVDRLKLLLYTLSGTMAAVAAIFTASRLNAKATSATAWS